MFNRYQRFLIEKNDKRIIENFMQFVIEKKVN